MKNRFDALTRKLAQSVTRRQALKRFGVGLAGMALTWFGLANQAEARATTCLPSGSKCGNDSQCCSGLCIHRVYFWPVRSVDSYCAY